MRGTPRVSRITRYDRDTRSYVDGDKIALQERTWDGIGRPEYDTITTFTADEARWVGADLLRLAEAIDGKKKRTSVGRKISKHTTEIAKAAKKEAMG